jgi:O-antigen/teichoic acid export membrane protein
VTADAALGRMVRGGAWLGGANAAGAALLVAQGVVATRALGATGFGVLAIAVAVVTVTRLLLSFRMGDVVVRYVAEARAAGDGAAAAAWIRAAALVEALSAAAAWLAVITIAPLAAAAFLDRAFATLIALYAVVLPATLVSETALGVLQVYRRYGLQAAAQLAERVVALVAVVAAASGRGDLTSFALAFAAGPVASGMVLTALAWTVAARELGDDFRRASLAGVARRGSEALRFAAATNVAGTLSLLTKDADPLWLGWLRNPVEAGLYRLAYNVGTLLFIPVAPLAQTVYPEAAQLTAERRPEALRQLVTRSVRPIAVFAVALVVLSLAVGRPVLAWVYGPEFGDAALALAVVLAGAGIGAATYWARPVVLAAGEGGYALLATAAAAAVKVAVVLAFVPRFGFLFAAVSLLAAYAVGAALLVRRARALLRGAARG